MVSGEEAKFHEGIKRVVSLCFWGCTGFCYAMTRWLMWTLVATDDLLVGEKEAYFLCLIRMGDDVVGG